MKERKLNFRKKTYKKETTSQSEKENRNENS